MNKKFTLRYFQPSQYQFSLDSIQFANEIVDFYRHRQDLHELRCLDLCAGCGVIGLEIYFHLRDIVHFDFVEIQTNYKKFFLQNLDLFDPPPQFHFFEKNYREHQGQYELIVCNPPYFFSGEGVLSPFDFKNRCRFYLDASFSELINSITHLLSPTGEAYVLISKGEAYGKNRIEEARAQLGADFSLESIGKIRITDLVRIKRKPFLPI